MNTILGELAPAPKFQSSFPVYWNELCPFCMLLEAGDFASKNDCVVTLFPGRKIKTSRLQVYIHPEDIVLPYAQDIPHKMVRQYWCFSLEQITLKCSCGKHVERSVERGYWSGF